MKFTKMHGAGNDFVVLETQDDSRDWPDLAIAICNRHYGVGADGMLLLMPSEKADFRMRIFNADGSEANTCGNGTRCLVRYYVETRGLKGQTRKTTVETLGGIRESWISRDARGTTSVKIRMGKPRFKDIDIPVSFDEANGGRLVDIKSMTQCELMVNGSDLSLNVMSLGNPHAVHFVDAPVADFPLARIGAEVQRHRMFPIGVNFEIARVLDKGRVEARVWEQGVGETLACGSGACAITVAALLHGRVKDRVEIMLPGGKLEVERDETGEVYLSGPAETVFSGDWPEEQDQPGTSRQADQRL